jgi:hypothetical protein
MLVDVIETIEIHIDRLEKATLEIKKLNSFNEVNLKDFEVIKTIDTFIYRFMKLQDYLGQKFFKVFLDEIGEYSDDMSLIDILDKLEKLNFINSSEEWMQIRKLRNKLAHEYPQSYDEIKNDLILAVNYYNRMKDIYLKMKNYLKEKGILK